MFQFSGLASCITGYHTYIWWVAPFGYSRINGYLHLPATFRSLSRPSSPLRAKASPVRPFVLSLAFSKVLSFGVSLVTLLFFFQHVNELYPEFGSVNKQGIEPFFFFSPPSGFCSSCSNMFLNELFCLLTLHPVSCFLVFTPFVENIGVEPMTS